MPAIAGKERIEQQLQEAIDRLRADLVRVEIWASALNGFSRPIPDYQPGNDVTRHLLPRGRDEGTPAKHNRAGAPERPDRLGEH